MTRPSATVEELLSLLPDVEEMESLRLGIIAAAVPDPGKAWDSSSAYATVDKRILATTELQRVVAEAEQSLRRQVEVLFGGIGPVLRSFYDGRSDEVARHLIDLGERMEAERRYVPARACYRAALRQALPLMDRSAQTVALRRIARASLTLGDFQDAASHYEWSAQVARDAGDVRSEVVARTGRGNVYLFQGRWPEAERAYLDALALAEGAEGLALECGQLFNNLGNIATRLERPEEAEVWLARASKAWQALSSPVDLAICSINVAHLREIQGRLADARAAYDAALALPVPADLQSGIATDLAELCIREGHVGRAEEWGRFAEERAIASGSPYTLGRMYQGRGNIARARGDDDGFTFFEKALEIARETGYPYLEAETLADYAQLRAASGGTEEAIAYLERAREILQQLGVVRDLTRVEVHLEELRARPVAALAGD